MNEKTITRKNGRHLRVPVLPDEETLIKENAARAGLKTAEYLRRLGLGHAIQSKLDQQHILDMVKINADLGRLGGLLKLWLTNDERLRHINKKTITVLLERIATTQETLFTAVQKI